MPPIVVYGIHAVAEAVRAGRAIEVRLAGRDDARLRSIVAEAMAGGVRVVQTTRDALDRASRGGMHQGIAAEVRERHKATLGDLCEVDGSAPLIVVLDGVEDPQNVGAIVRSVDAAGASGLVRQSRRAAALEGSAARASAGAIHHVRIADAVNIARALEDLKQRGLWTVGLDAAGETPYYEVDLTLPTALVVGAEGYGLRRLVRDRCDVLASIPMAGHVSSLNVSAATAIVLFDAVRQRRSRASRGRQGP
jgi:23S rRNA (guanosine2251-2'-O)-methyltransferase